MHRTLPPKRASEVRNWPLLWLVAAAFISGCHGRAAQEQGDKADPALVKVLQPQLRTIIRHVEQPSFVDSYERSSVYPKMSAYIEKWNVDIGDHVKKGDVLARLFVPEVVEEWHTKQSTVKLDVQRVSLAKELVEVAEADVKAAEARLKEARALLAQYQAQVDRWKTEVNRLQREVDKGVVDPQVLLESTNQLKASTAARDAAEATIAKAQAELVSKRAVQQQESIGVEVASADLQVARSEEKRLEALVGYLVLPAPFDGIVTARNANTFDFVLPRTGDPSAMRNAPDLSPSGSAAPIYVVERTDVVRVFVDIPEADANFVHRGTRATVLIQAFSDQPIAASVTRTAWALNVRSRTLRAEVDLPNTSSVIPGDVPEFIRDALSRVKLPGTSNQILPGMYAYGTVIVERKGVWALPRGVLDYRRGQAFYWTVTDGRAMRMEVLTGVSDSEWTEVTRRRPLAHSEQPWMPLDGSEQAITGDLSSLLEGAPAQITHASPAAEAANTNEPER